MRVSGEEGGKMHGDRPGRCRLGGGGGGLWELGLLERWKGSEWIDGTFWKRVRGRYRRDSRGSRGS